MRRKKLFDWGTWTTVATAIVGLAAGALLNAWTIAEKLATKPYVDEKFADGKRYTDERTIQTLKEAYEHSDMNRREITIEQAEAQKSIIAEMQGIRLEERTEAATTKTTLDLLVHAVQQMRDDSWAYMQRHKAK